MGSTEADSAKVIKDTDEADPGREAKEQKKSMHKVALFLFLAALGVAAVFYLVGIKEFFFYNYLSPEQVKSAIEEPLTEQLVPGKEVVQYFTPRKQHITTFGYYIVNVPANAPSDAALHVTLSNSVNETVSERTIPMNKVQNAAWTVDYYREGLMRLPLNLDDSEEYHLTLSVSGCSADLCPSVILTRDHSGISELGKTLYGGEEVVNYTLFMGIGYPMTSSGYVILMTVLLALFGAIFSLECSGTIRKSGRRIWTYIKEEDSKNHFEDALVVCMLVLWFFLSVPVIVYRLQNVGLDPSWRWMLNVAGDKNAVFGKDLFFSYGPLGFVYYLMKLDNTRTYLLGLLIWAGILAVHLFLFGGVYRGYRQRRISFAAVGLAFLVYAATFHESWCDSYIQFLIMLSLVLWDRGDKTAAVPLNLMLCFSFFGKIVGFLSGLFMVFVYCAYLIVTQRDVKLAKRMKLFLLPVPALFGMIVGYLLYAGSVQSFIGYLYNIYKNVSGFNQTQQMDDAYSVLDFTSFFLILFAYLTVMVLFMLKDNRRAGIILAGGVPLFAAYKYGVTAHMIECSTWVAVMPLSALLLVMPIGRIFSYEDRKEKEPLPMFEPEGENRTAAVFSGRMQAVLCLCAVMIGVLFAWNGHGTLAGLRGNLSAKADVASHLTRDSRTEKLYTETSLPQTIIDTVGDSSVGIYPWDLAYGAVYKQLNLQFSPTGYDGEEVYNAWLDAKSAAYYKENGPEYVILECQTVYSQLNFMNNPQIWAAMRQNYEAVYTDTNFCLLKRRETPKADAQRTLLASDTYTSGEKITCPSGAKYAVVHMEYSLAGTVKGIFWRYGVTSIHLDYSDGRSADGTILIPHMISGFTLDYYPQNTNDVQTVLNTENYPKIASFEFYGEGLKSMEDTIQIDWYTE